MSIVGKECVLYSSFTQDELRKIHRTLGHPSWLKIGNLLRRSDIDVKLDGGTRRAIEQIRTNCEICNEKGAVPRRFKLTIGTGEFRLKNSVQVDKKFIDGKEVHNIVDEANHLSAASFLSNKSAEEILRTISRIWSLHYIDP